MKIWSLLFFVFAVGCSSAPFQGPMPVQVGDVDQEYRMGVGDKISIQVWKSPELSIQVPVRPDGKISAPLVGDVQVAGVSTSELSAELTTEFSQYVRNPQVTVIVLDPVSADFLHRVRVTGAVKSPLSLTYRQGITVLDLVLEAGGLTEFASANNAKLYRKFGDGVQVFSVRLDDILEKGAIDTNFVLSPSDILAIPERIF